MARKVLITVAPVKTPGDEPPAPARNPLTPEEIAEDVIACHRRGAGMVHLHVRDSSGRPTADLKEFSRTIDLISSRTDIILQGSTGGLSTLSLQERCVSLEEPRVEVASLNMGSVNFPGDGVYINTRSDIRYWAERMREARVRPELEIFDLSMIASVLALTMDGTLGPPLDFNLCVGMQGALPADARNLFLLQSALPAGALWGLVHDGMRNFRLTAAAVGMGASVIRVGFEDSAFVTRDKVARTNAELVEAAVDLLARLDMEPATPSEAREWFAIGK